MSLNSVKWERLAPWLGLGGIVVILLAFGAYVFVWHTTAQAKLADVEPRVARLLGLEKQKGDLDQALAQSQAIVNLHAYPDSQDPTQSGNDAQRRVRDVFVKAGLDVMSSQVLPAKQEKQFDRIPIVVRFEGELSAVQSALVALGSLPAPSVQVEGFNMQTIGPVKAEVAQKLGGQFNLYILRVHP